MTYSRHKSLKVLLTAAAFSVVTGPAAASAILAVSNNNDFGIALNTGAPGGAEAAGTFFTLTERYTNVSIAAPILCVQCAGSVVLQHGPLGSSATAADLVVGMNFTTSLGTLFTGLSLGPGTYALLAGVNSGIGGWSGSVTPTVISDGFSTDGMDIETLNAAFFLPQSTFVPTFANGSLAYTINGDRVVTNTPLPATALLLIGGLPTFGLLRRKRGRSPAQSSACRPVGAPLSGG